MKVRGADFNSQVQGDGQAFVWGHGLSNNMEAEDWLGWFDWPSFPEDIRLIRYDARGHGKTETAADPLAYTWPELGLDMLAIANAHGVDRFVAGGASMGCSTALFAAMKAPERIMAMVLVIPPTAWESRAAQASTYRRSARIGGVLGGRLLGAAMKRQATDLLAPWMLEEAPRMIEGMAMGLRPQTRRGLRNMFLGAGASNLPEPAAFEPIAHIPAIILPWTEDPSHPVATAEQLHRLLPNSELVVEEGFAGLEAFPDRIREFVARYA